MYTLRALLRTMLLLDGANDGGTGGGQPPAGGAPTDPPAGAAPAAKTFTQEDLDRQIGERLARERAKYEGFDDFRTKAAEFDKLEAAKLSETERLTRERDEALQAGSKATERANAALVRAALLAESAGTVDPDAVNHFALQKGTVTVSDDGTVTGAKEAVEAVLAEKQYLVGAAPRSPGPGDGGPQTPPPAQGDIDAQIAEASSKKDWPTVNRLNAQKFARTAGLTP